jgi:citrate/tricarballylate utilization protein
MHGTSSLTALADGHATETLAEADRLMTVCNSCRYCEGLCAVFPAMEMRRAFSDGDLNYLANLCHACGACYYDCQFSPPHEYNVNVPKVLAKVRANSYSAYAWPAAFRGVFARNGLFIAIAAALGIAGFVLGVTAWSDPSVLWGAHSGPEAFYRLIPHNVMALMFGAAFLYALIAISFGVRAFWRHIGEPWETMREPRSLWSAIKDAAQLRYLDGGAAGCMNDDAKLSDSRKHFHHLTFYGFLLCFASTSVATAYHYLLGREAPYAWYDLPVLLGAVGGLGLIIGPIGLLMAKSRRDPMLADEARYGMDAGFILMLLITSATGLALLVLRESTMMSLLLSIHLGVVFSLFLTLPYSKFVHGIYRFLALVRYARERRVGL